MQGDLDLFFVEHLNRLCRHSLTLVPRELPPQGAFGYLCAVQKIAQMDVRR